MSGEEAPMVVLGGAAVKASKDVDRLEALTHRLKWLVRWAIAGLVLDIVLTGLFFFDYQNNAAEVQARCVAGNVFRMQDKAKWTFILNLSNPKHETADARHVLHEFRVLVDTSDAPQRCS